MRACHTVFLIVGLVLPAAARDTPAPKPGKVKKQRSPGDIDFEFDRRPILRVGNWLRVEFRARMQADFRGFSPDYETDEGTFDLRRVRLGVEGRAFRDFEYEIDASVDNTFDSNWRDVYVNYRRFRGAQIQGGKFKLPFGMEQLTPFSRLDFVFRALISDTIAPARDIGGILHGRFFSRALEYQAGWFRGDGENAYRNQSRTGDRAWVLRLQAVPARLFSKQFQGPRFGAGAMTSSVPEGLNSFRLRSVARETIMPRVYAKGRRLRLGAEMEWPAGPFALKGEFMHSRTERRDQGIRGDDLPDLVMRGWYGSATWLLTGERKEERVTPKRPFLQHWGLGALELGTRYEQIRFGSETSAGIPLTNPRAANIRAQSDRVWTHGVTWFLNSWSRIQFNGVHETIEDPARAIIEGKTRYWLWAARLQFAM